MAGPNHPKVRKRPLRDSAFLEVEHSNQPLGEGAFGKVLRGRYKGKPCAVKYAHNAIQAEALKREGDFGYGLSQANPHAKRLVVTHSIGRRRGQEVVVMELADGDLNQMLQEQPEFFTDPQIIRAVRHLLRGLEEFHEGNAIHRDVATRNYLVKYHSKQQPTYKLGDFGRSKPLPEDAETDYVHTPEENTGPLRWMSAREIRERKSSKSSDLWALAVTLFELANQGQKPYMEYPLETVAALIMNDTMPLPYVDAASMPLLYAVQKILFAKCYQDEGLYPKDDSFFDNDGDVRKILNRDEALKGRSIVDVLAEMSTGDVLRTCRAALKQYDMQMQLVSPSQSDSSVSPDEHTNESDSTSSSLSFSEWTPSGSNSEFEEGSDSGYGELPSAASGSSEHESDDVADADDYASSGLSAFAGSDSEKDSVNEQPTTPDSIGVDPLLASLDLATPVVSLKDRAGSACELRSVKRKSGSGAKLSASMGQLLSALPEKVQPLVLPGLHPSEETRTDEAPHPELPREDSKVYSPGLLSPVEERDSEHSAPSSSALMPDASASDSNEDEQSDQRVPVDSSDQEMPQGSSRTRRESRLPVRGTIERGESARANASVMTEAEPEQERPGFFARIISSVGEWFRSAWHKFMAFVQRLFGSEAKPNHYAAQSPQPAGESVQRVVSIERFAGLASVDSSKQLNTLDSPRAESVKRLG